MIKLFKSKKALSPVVASIILIAVTVAVSIAVAAWMGALTFTFMKTEELKITNMQFLTTGTTKTFNLTVQNPGTSKVTITGVKVNDVAVPGAISGSLDWVAGNSHNIGFNLDWISGNKYKVTLLSATGTIVAAYENTA
jgi:flagellin-like protein